MSEIDTAELLEICCAIAAEAGAMAASMRDAGVSVAATKSSQLDIVTQADTAVETLIRKRLDEARPEDGFFGEESGTVAGRTGITWIVDPIDGTVNYLYGSPYYAVSIAATVRDEVGRHSSVAGCVFAPALKAEYTAASDQPARLNSAPIHVNTGVPLEKALVSTGIPYDLTQRPRVLQDITALTPRIRDIRLGGSAALDICAVAEGRTDGHFQRGLPIWDYAAATLITARAGADVRIVDDGPARARMLLIADADLDNALAPHLA